MPICRWSGTDMRAAAIATLASISLASPQAEGAQSAATGAKAGIEKEGAAAAERLKKAIAAQRRQGPQPHSSVPQDMAPDIRRRAFEALRTRPAAPEMEARARVAAKQGQGALAAERDRVAKQLGQALGLELPEMQDLAKGSAPSRAPGWVPVLFVSSSMPVATLRTYAGQLERVHGVMAFRGMPGGLNKVAPMARLSAQILRINPGCEGPACAMRDVQLIVDPIVFRQHGVSRVPALAMIPGDPTRPYCERDDESPRGGNIVFGDAALTGLLEEYGRLGGREEVRDAQALMGSR